MESMARQGLRIDFRELPPRARPLSGAEISKILAGVRAMATRRARRTRIAVTAVWRARPSTDRRLGRPGRRAREGGLSFADRAVGRRVWRMTHFPDGRYANGARL
jgi:hypothetical protein